MQIGAEHRVMSRKSETNAQHRRTQNAQPMTVGR